MSSVRFWVDIIPFLLNLNIYTYYWQVCLFDLIWFDSFFCFGAAGGGRSWKEKEEGRKGLLFIFSFVVFIACVATDRQFVKLLSVYYFMVMKRRWIISKEKKEKKSVLKPVHPKFSLFDNVDDAKCNSWKISVRETKLTNVVTVFIWKEHWAYDAES